MPRQLLSRPWTEQDDAKLRALHHQGKQRRTIAVRLRRSSSAVTSRIRALLGRQREAREAR
jgi:hypothetical protein